MEPKILEGGCLCGHVRYEAYDEPARVAFCYCRYCQRLTGSSNLIKANYRKEQVKLLAGTPVEYATTSSRPGRTIFNDFCPKCGSTVFNRSERSPEMCGVLAGTFDNPDGFDRNTNPRHIFADFAQDGTIIPAGVPVFREHIEDLDDEPVTPKIYEQHHVVRKNKLVD